LPVQTERTFRELHATSYFGKHGRESETLPTGIVGFAVKEGVSEFLKHVLELASQKAPDSASRLDSSVVPSRRGYNCKFRASADADHGTASMCMIGISVVDHPLSRGAADRPTLVLQARNSLSSRLECSTLYCRSHRTSQCQRSYQDHQQYAASRAA